MAEDQTTSLLCHRLACGVALLLPQRAAVTLHLVAFRDQHGDAIGLGFVLSWAIWISWALAGLVSIARARWKAGSFKRNAPKAFRRLDPEELKVLRRYISSATKTQPLDLTDGVTRSLEAAGIIYRAANVSMGMTRFAFNIQPWAWEYLHEHPEAITLSTSDLPNFPGGVRPEDDDDAGFAY